MNSVTHEPNPRVTELWLIFRPDVLSPVLGRSLCHPGHIDVERSASHKVNHLVAVLVSVESLLISRKGRNSTNDLDLQRCRPILDGFREKVVLPV